jgi:glutamate racemase
MAAPTILVFDSGLGGLTVHAEIVALRPHARYIYLADDAVFPYGGIAADVLTERVCGLLDRQIARLKPDIVIVACNTASTLVLPRLRATWPGIPFVGTVPAVKPAAYHSASKLISVLATPATVARDYTHDLIRQHASHCEVQLVGAPKLASLAEAFMKGEEVADADIASEIESCFVEKEGRRTDHVVLACTHYPLLLDAFRRIEPWPVTWVDPVHAIARRADHVLEDAGFPPEPHGGDAPAQVGFAEFTSNRAPGEALSKALAARGLAWRAMDEPQGDRRVPKSAALR